jgi:hypothetical protein
MSINNICSKFKRYWAAFIAGLIFFVLGALTLWGITIWYLGATTLTWYTTGLVVLGAVTGLFELIESYRLCRIPFKNK